MGRRDPERRDRLRQSMTHQASRARDLADEMARWDGGCDDPLHPYGPQVFRDWLDFVDRVARPLVEAEDDREAEQAAMVLYWKVSPYYLCAALVMAANRIAAEGTADSTPEPTP